MTETQAIAPKPDQALRPSLTTEAGFELLQRQARMYSESPLVPKHFAKNIGSCAIALQMADRIGADPMSVMQSLYVVHGTPSWSATFLIGCINSCGRFTPLRYRFSGKKGEDNWSCIAYATDLKTDTLLEGTEVSIGMAKKQGWYNKTGSYWQTMPEQMLRYRSATYWARTYAPELALGMRTADELHDGNVIEGESEVINAADDIMDKLKAAKQ